MGAVTDSQDNPFAAPWGAPRAVTPPGVPVDAPPRGASQPQPQPQQPQQAGDGGAPAAASAPAGSPGGSDVWSRSGATVWSSAGRSAGAPTRVPVTPGPSGPAAAAPVPPASAVAGPAPAGYAPAPAGHAPGGAAPAGPVPAGPVPVGPAPAGPWPPSAGSSPGQQPWGALPGNGGWNPQGGLDSWGRPVPVRRERRRGLGAGLVAGLLVLALAAGALGGWGAQSLLARADQGRAVDGSLPVAVERDPAAGELTGVAEVAAEVLPSVVAIQVRGPQGGGTGSGFVLREDGYILTNSHVVAAADGGAAQIVVVFSDGSEGDATIVGRTSDYDLAVIRVDRSGLTPLTLADSDAVVVGDPVIAIGAPLGLQGTVTTGIVSALNRPVSAGNEDETAFIDAIQTDAAINPGNSGGPLVDAEGQVVGINSAIAQPPGLGAAGGSIGLGFAIPANQARRTAQELIETGRATYPVIGVVLDGTYTGEGVQVAGGPQGEFTDPVTPGGPADRAGIRPGDVILAIDGRPVTESDELVVAIRARAPGDAVTLTVRGDDGQERQVRVVLDEVASG